MKDKLRRLERLAAGNVVSIPQPGGEPPARFPESQLPLAYTSALARELGDASTPNHPLSRAARRSPDPEWSRSVIAEGAEVGEPPEDLSEP